MSGLVALMHRDGRPIHDAYVWSMLAAAPYRGPDGLTVRTFGMVSLGHAKMAVTAEDRDDLQPRVSARTGCAIVADVRLDDRQHLLSLLPDVAPTSSDAELILRAYESWGLDAFASLLGDFAVVIWDPSRERLILARDTSGQRSLFYRRDARMFAAASEIHQLLQDPEIPVLPNEDRIRDLLVPINIFRNEKDQAATFYEGISAVPAGHTLVVDRRSERLHRYWELSPQREIRYRREEEYAEHYRELFLTVVRSRLRASGPVGALLSGGLDSSAVVCAAQALYSSGRATDNGFVSFTSTFDGLDCDERDLVADIQRMHGFDARFLPLPPTSGWLQRSARGFQASPNLGPRAGRDAMFGAIAAAGVRVVLTGEIADACVAGSPLFLDSLLRRGQVADFATHLRLFLRGSSDSWQRIALLYCIGPLLPLRLQRSLESVHIRRAVRAHHRDLLPPWMPQPLRDDLARRHLALSLGAESRRRFSSPARESELRMLYAPEVAHHPAPWPVEIWRPFADRRLHEFLLAVPPEVKFRPHPTDRWYAAAKHLVRESMRGLLPETVRTRTTKTTFSSVFESEISRDWASYEGAFGPSALSEIAGRGYVEPAPFWARLRALRDGNASLDQIYLTHMVGLESWLRALKLPRPQLVTVPFATPVRVEDPPAERAGAHAVSVA